MIRKIALALSAAALVAIPAGAEARGGYYGGYGYGYPAYGHNYGYGAPSYGYGYPAYGNYGSGYPG